ncbi:hypothetical protein ACFQ0R_00025 [Psychroflexus salinarum]|uniref:DUF7829 domain-containing protein n=1 Tax=Psychroflexus salinarum TaxID=546024 RepID=A0ABW3GQR4_9FLAO
MITWRKYIVDKYVENLELSLLGKPYNSEYIHDFSFNTEEQAYLESKFNLKAFLNTETPLIALMNADKKDLVNHFLLHTEFKVSVNEVRRDQTLFTYYTGYYLSKPKADLSENYLMYQYEMTSLFSKGYMVKEQDFEFMKPYRDYTDPRQLKYIMFASYVLKLDDKNLVYSLSRHIELITSLTSVKTGKQIGFYKTVKDQILRTSLAKSAYQNEIISYIRKHRKTEYKDIEKRLLEERLNVSERIQNPELLSVLNLLNL